MRKTGPTGVARQGLQGQRTSLELAIDAEYLIPNTVELEGDKLIWNWSGGQKRVKEYKGLLDGFVRLHNASSGDILAYAHCWGVLNPCPVHNRPEEARNKAANSFCFFSHPNGHWEPLEEWRTMSRQFEATIQIAYDIATGKPTAAQNWELLYGKLGSAGQTALNPRGALLEHLNLSLFASGVRPQIRWRNESYAVDFHVESLHGSLVAQTTLLVAQRGIAICASCGRLFAPKQIKPGLDAYCDGPYCGRKAAVRAAQRRRYQRKTF